MTNPTQAEKMTGDLALLKRLAEKIVEPMCDDAPQNKTIGQWRKELGDLLYEVVEYVAVKNAQDQMRSNG